MMEIQPVAWGLHALTSKSTLDDDALALADDVAVIAENAAAIAECALVGWRAALDRLAKLEAMIGTVVE
jgi:hypothetical protein